MVVVVPVPLIPPGLSVQLPDGSPFNTTLPVDAEQVGWVIEPIVGADGAPGADSTVSMVDGETHPVAFSFTFIL